MHLLLGVWELVLQTLHAGIGESLCAIHVETYTILIDLGGIDIPVILTRRYASPGSLINLLAIELIAPYELPLILVCIAGRKESQHRRQNKNLLHIHLSFVVSSHRDNKNLWFIAIIYIICKNPAFRLYLRGYGTLCHPRYPRR